jgi:hypothetical protein
MASPEGPEASIEPPRADRILPSKKEENMQRVISHLALALLLTSAFVPFAARGLAAGVILPRPKYEQSESETGVLSIGATVARPL